MINANKVLGNILGNPIKKDFKSKNNKKIILPNKCAYCDKELYLYDEKDINERNYTYRNGEYVCKECYNNSDIKLRSRTENKNIRLKKTDNWAFLRK